MSRYSWIILDADNTVFDFDRAEHAALARTLAGFGLECTETIRAEYAAISARLWRAFEAGELTSERLRVARFEELLRGRPEGHSGEVVNLVNLHPPASPEQTFAGERRRNRATPHEVGSGEFLTADGRNAGAAQSVSDRYIVELGRESGLLPGAESVVRSLASTHRLLLATNGISDIQRRRFGASVLADSFEDMVISDEIGVAKPHPAFFDEVFHRMGNPAKGHVLMVGDSLSSDIAGGIGYGIDTCWFDHRALGESAPLKHEPPLEPTYRILELEELLGVVHGGGLDEGTDGRASGRACRKADGERAGERMGERAGEREKADE